VNFLDLLNKPHKWNLSGHIPALDDERPRSSLHIQCKSILKEIFPCVTILEEVPLPSTRLFFDFYIPIYKMAIEVHGEQHYGFNKFFHKTAGDFKVGLKRDKLKAELCGINSIQLVELPYNKIKDWQSIIMGALL
jgi:hypothetical protein